ncbi:unnamed protein product [Linum tenue]|uniref:KIB1-4 beta-propeller domain-containing protein n=1 Tax=Linum tenue TaxID=586396 RepID=A0AAV0RD84_9ROSI|nr:unnamed protein product [Linum tenue]
MADWQNLPDELLDIIATKLTTISANIRFTGACRSWRIAGLQHRLPLTQRRRIPGLMLPPNGHRKVHNFPCKFIPLTEFINHGKNKKKKNNNNNRGGEIPWRFGKSSVCIGSLKGWMLILDHDCKWRLQNPVTGAEFALPATGSRLKRGENYQPYVLWYNRHRYRVSIWAPPPPPPWSGGGGGGHSVSVSDWFVSVVEPWKPRVRYCRVGDSKWVVVDFSEHGLVIVDAIWAEEEGSLYVLNAAGELFCCEGGGPEKKQNKRLVALGRDHFLGQDQWGAFKFLVEVEGEILLLSRRMEAPQSDGMFEYKRTSGFDVYRLDRERMAWAEMAELGELAVFVGFGQPFWVRVEPESGIKGNCIYYLDMEEKENRCSKTIWYGICAYDLKTSTVEFLDFELEMRRYGKPARLPIPIAPEPW